MGRRHRRQHNDNNDTSVHLGPLTDARLTGALCCTYILHCFVCDTSPELVHLLGYAELLDSRLLPRLLSTFELCMDISSDTTLRANPNNSDRLLFENYVPCSVYHSSQTWFKPRLSRVNNAPEGNAHEHTDG